MILAMHMSAHGLDLWGARCVESFHEPVLFLCYDTYITYDAQEDSKARFFFLKNYAVVPQ